MEKNKINNIYNYIIYFFIFSVFGWILETVYCFIVSGHFTNRGFLYGPLCPIYGWGGIILIVLLSKYKNNTLKLFTYSAIIFSVFEYYVSYVLEALFRDHWWDYTNQFLNLNGRIGIFYSFAWGILAVIFINFLFPYIKKKIDTLLSKISYKKATICINLLIIVFVLDTIISSINYLI